jgi:hypothetical protein
MEITNRSGYVTRDYRLTFLPDRVRISHVEGRMSYDVFFDEEREMVVCTCPAFETDGCCKHRDSLLSLMEKLNQRLGSSSGQELREEAREAA